MDTTVIDISGVPTRILTWGKKLGDKFDRKEIVLFVTGNPGLSGFYITFLTTLFRFLQGNIPVWIIGWLYKWKLLSKNKQFHENYFTGHAGHDEPEIETAKIPRLKHNKNLYNIDGQINHKVQHIWWHFITYNFNSIHLFF